MTISVKSFEKLVGKFGKVKALVLFFEIAPEETKEALTWQEARDLFIESLGSKNENAQFHAFVKMHQLSQVLREDIFVFKNALFLADSLAMKNDDLERIELVDKIKRELEGRFTEKHIVLEDWMDVYVESSREIILEHVKKDLLAYMQARIEQIITADDNNA